MNNKGVNNGNIGYYWLRVVPTKRSLLAATNRVGRQRCFQYSICFINFNQLFPFVILKINPKFITDFIAIYWVLKSSIFDFY
jgi:hypothetical protein